MCFCSVFLSVIPKAGALALLQRTEAEQGKRKAEKKKKKSKEKEAGGAKLVDKQLINIHRLLHQWV